jgi:TolA-binding protein
MLRPQKKVHKKEIKEDALISSYVRLTTWYENNKRIISIVVVSAAVVIGATLVYLKNRADDDAKAATQLGQIFSYYDGGQYQVAIDGVPERSLPGLKSIVDNFGGSHSGNIARYYLAYASYELGKYQEALQEYEAMSSGNDLLEMARLAGIGACYEAQGNNKEAAAYYEKAASVDAKFTTAPDNLNQAARNYGIAGDKEKAIELYKKLKKNYPTSPYAREADRYIAALSV